MLIHIMSFFITKNTSGSRCFLSGVANGDRTRDNTATEYCVTTTP